MFLLRDNRKELYHSRDDYRRKDRRSERREYLLEAVRAGLDERLMDTKLLHHVRYAEKTQNFDCLACF